MKRVMIKVAYDGTGYHGFQAQRGLATIQGELTRAVFLLTGEEVDIIGGSRTDAGVHSMGNIAVFDTDSRIEPANFSKALNTKLPGDIVVWCAKEVAGDFHPRRRASRKIYEYTVLNSEYDIPVYSRYSHHVRRKLDISAMEEAAKRFEGRHDFTSFCTLTNDTRDMDRVRTIFHAGTAMDEREESLLRFRVEGDGFLYNMVRIMAGTLIETGLGRFTPDDITRMIEGKDRRLAGHTAPAKGLCHMETIFLESE